MSKLFTVKFTADELHELNGLLANGVCAYDDPSNTVARSAYNKIGRAAVNAYKVPRRALSDAAEGGQ